MTNIQSIVSLHTSTSGAAHHVLFCLSLHVGGPASATEGIWTEANLGVGRLVMLQNGLGFYIYIIRSHEQTFGYLFSSFPSLSQPNKVLNIYVCTTHMKSYITRSNIFGKDEIYQRPGILNILFEHKK